MKEAYVYMYRNKNNGKVYIGSRSSYKGSCYDDFNIKYFSSSRNKEFICARNNNELEGEIICKINSLQFPKDDVRKIILQIEDKFIQSFWNKYGKENSYNTHSNGHWNNYNVKPSYGFKGKHHSDEFRQKVSERNKIRIVSEETRNKISISIKNRYKNHDNPMKGKHHSEESKKLMSIKSIGKKHTPETLEKISKANKGKKRKLDKWLTETGDIVYMYAGPVKRFHKNWIKIE